MWPYDHLYGLYGPCFGPFGPLGPLLSFSSSMIRIFMGQFWISKSYHVVVPNVGPSYCLHMWAFYPYPSQYGHSILHLDLIWLNLMIDLLCERYPTVNLYQECDPTVDLHQNANQLHNSVIWPQLDEIQPLIDYVATVQQWIFLKNLLGGLPSPPMKDFVARCFIALSKQHLVELRLEWSHATRCWILYNSTKSTWSWPILNPWHF